MAEKKTSRMGQIMHILRENEIMQGLTPEKLKNILEELGPTFIKFGQILSMRPDLLPDDYCKELEALRSDVIPMPFSLVKELIEKECQQPIEKVFSKIDETPLGSASIGQVHKASLLDGTSVVVKIQRPNIKETMEADIKMCKKALVMLKVITPGHEVVDFNVVLDEMWEAALHEFNFLEEANNLKKFAQLNENIAYVTCPTPDMELSTGRMLVMEYIDGIPVDHIETLELNGYDIKEIGDKLAENYVKQVLTDAFFHADPHQGNIFIRDGKIVWMDMGMMGTLTERDRELFSSALEAVVLGDIYELKDAIMAIGVIRGKVDHNALYNDLDYIITKYGKMDFQTLNIAEIIQEIQDVLARHHISIGSGMTMLIRGIITIEGVLREISPETDFMKIFSNHVRQGEFNPNNYSQDLKMMGINTMHLLKQSAKMPSNIMDLLKMTVRGQTKINIELSESAEFFSHLNGLINRLVIALIDAALLIASSLICTTNMKGQFLGIPILGVVGYGCAIVLGVWLLVDAIKQHRKK